MNFSEFKRLLGAEPNSQDPGFLAARKSGAEFVEAARDADEFEQTLKLALQVQAPATLLADFHERRVLTATTRRFAGFPMALAASLFLMLAASMIYVWQNNQHTDLNAYVLNHWQFEGERVSREAVRLVAPQQVQKIMASVNASASDTLALQVYLIKNCPTPDGQGAHLVVMTDAGPVTIFYLPETGLDADYGFDLPGMFAYMVALEQGSAAVVGPSAESAHAVAAQLHTGIRAAPTANI